MRTRTVFVIIVSLLTVLPMFGQGGRGQGQGQRGPGQGEGQRPQMTEENVKQRVTRTAEALELNEDQKKKIMDYEVQAFRAGQAERQRLRGDREAMRSYMQEQREQRDKKYKEVLSEEQYKKYAEQREKRREEMQNRQRPQEGGGGERPARGRGR